MTLLFPIIAIFALPSIKTEPITFQNVTLWTSVTDKFATITGRTLKDHLPVSFLPSLIVTGKITTLYKNSIGEVNVGELFFQENEIRDVESGAFNNLSVKTLVVNRSNLTEIEDGMFGGAMEQLQVSFNSVSKLSGRAFVDLPKLKRLILWHNKLNTLPESVFHDLSLEFLDLSENEISELPREVFRKLPQLKMLVLKKNKLVHVPREALEGLPLHHLDLSGNFIKTLPSFLGTLPHLVSVSFARNNITVVPNGVFNNTNLQQVELNNNDISQIESAAFDNMPLLSNVFLSYNKLKKYDVRWFNNSRSVYRLFLSNNLIEYLPEGAFRSIGADAPKWLGLEGNKIKKITPKTFEGLQKLDSLVLGNNEIEEWHEDFLSGVDTIYYLSLANNKIRCPEGSFEKIFKAHFTYLSENPLSNECVNRIENWLRNKRVHVSFN